MVDLDKIDPKSFRIMSLDSPVRDVFKYMAQQGVNHAVMDLPGINVECHITMVTPDKSQPLLHAIRAVLWGPDA